MPENGARIERLSRSPGGVPKTPIDSAEVGWEGIAGDGHNEPRFHGGPMRALCLYSMERIEQLNAEGHPIAPGTAGENVTVRGLDWDAVTPGKRYRFGGEVEIEITDYTTPCPKIARSFTGGQYERILQKKNPGMSRVYARILRTGTLRVGDAVTEIEAGETAEERG